MAEVTATPERSWFALPAEEVAAALEVDPAQGLTAAEAAARLERHGPNRFAEATPEPRWRAFVRQYRDPMQIVLLVAGIGSIVPLEQYATGIVLILLTVLNAVLGLRQEGKAAAAVAALQKMMIIKAKARRDGALVVLPAEQLVPGDVVSIEAGDIVPADGRLLAAATLEVAEAALTGESLPVAKSVEPVAGEEVPLGDRTDMVFMNTNTTRGTGQFVVTATGMATEVGHVSGLLQEQDDTETPLTRQLAALTRQILLIAGVAVAISMILNLSRGDSFKLVFTAAIAFAISAIPTGLPAVVTTILSLGTQTARARERDREAPALDRDARLDLRDLLRQDRHAHAEPDDGRRADDPRPPVLDLGQRLRDRGDDQARRGPARGPARAVPPADGARRRTPWSTTAR